MKKQQFHERRLTVDRRQTGLADRRALIRYEPDNEPRRSGHDRRVSEVWQTTQNLA